MTGSTRLTQAVDAMQKAWAAENALTKPASLKFVVVEDNGGGYHWTIVADGGETLVRSASFESYEDAKQAAGIVHRGASRAAFEQGSDNPRLVDLPARRNAVSARDRLDADRWFDEGGSFSSEAVAR